MQYEMMFDGGVLDFIGPMYSRVQSMKMKKISCLDLAPSHMNQLDLQLQLGNVLSILS